ncbi:hypothetical protein ACFY0F_37605 [Streptomyces sp. NPDC001544]|uniref:hypothetical protein n=1 Tax=Streptomyces sp. NPDC001544 TaxID=3364584 RepID=UPI0036CA5EA0
MTEKDKQHQADVDRVSFQNNFTDIARGFGGHPHGGGGLIDVVGNAIRAVAKGTPYSQAMVSRTEFDRYDLNVMLDLVEQTDPEDLESSGRALWDARDAIKAAADDLKGQFDTVPWVGKAGDNFRAWGAGLVTSTYHLSAFAGGAGDQIAAAAEGLASVRKAMPPRDTRADPTPAKDFPAHEKVASNKDYAAAVQVEKHRQEAINQMNRLASYYAVANESLQDLHKNAPEFKGLPAVGVPEPNSSPDPASGGPGSHGSAGTGSTAVGGHHTAVAQVHHAAVAQVHHASVPDASGAPALVKDATVQVRHPDVPVGTHIDSTGTLPTPTTTTPGPSHTPPVTGTSPASGSQPNVFDGGGLRLPVPNATSGRGLSGAGGFRTPPSAQTRAGASELTNPGSGRSTGRGLSGQMGRATSTGQSAVNGTGAGPRASSPMGRGITGGTPRPAGPAAQRTTSGPTTGAGRSNGVVGGRPSSTNPSSKNGARGPRGTVIGGEEEGSSRSTTGRLGQRGVFGRPEPESTARSGSAATGSRAGAGTSEAVTGRPTARTSAAGAERNGMTHGGAGLTRGAGHNGRPSEERRPDGTPRPDYLVEDEEAHLPNGPRRDVPPVIN